MTEGNLTGPEGILMLCVAGLLDAIGFGLFLLCWLGVDDYGVLDMIGTAIIGFWMLVRYSSLGTKGAEGITEEAETGSSNVPDNAPKTAQQKGTQTVKKTIKRSLKRFGITFGVELIPFLGGIAPGWTILVWKELKK